MPEFIRRPIVCTDMDNTLVSGQSYHPSTPKAIAALDRKGIRIIPVTGRGPDLARGVLNELNIPLYPGGYHHGAITYDADGNILIDKHVSSSVVQTLNNAILDIQKDPDLGVKLSTLALMAQGLNYRYIVHDATGKASELLQELGSTRAEFDVLNQLEDLDNTDAPLYQVSLVAFVHDEYHAHDTLVEVAGRVNYHLTKDQHHSYCLLISGENFLDITRDDVNKAKAIEAISDTLKFDMKDVIALGDAQNDIPLLKAAGFSICMAGVPEDVRSAATVMSPSKTLHGGWARGIIASGVLESTFSIDT